MSSHPKVSVIISTYNQPEWLDLVLHSYSLQSSMDFELVIADDGSDKRTEQIIKTYKSETDLNLVHVWHEDKGFRKTMILNKAITTSKSDYLIFTDGDCIARQDFVETHLSLRRNQHALSGGYFKLSKSISELMSKSLITEQRCFDKTWLLNKGQSKSFKLNKLTKSKRKAALLNNLTPTKATFDGMNVSCFKKDIVAVNGFDERMQYGGEDREVGERMMNNGIKFLQVRYSAICVHLHHERPYENAEAKEQNLLLRKETKKNKAIFTKHGIQK